MSILSRVFLFSGLMVGRLYAGSLEGRVTDSITGAGIAGAPVFVIAPDRPDPAATVTTDDSGWYRVASLPDGPYYTVVTKAGYTPGSDPAARAVHAIAGATRVDLTVTRLATVRGRVVDADKNAVAGITVHLQMDTRGQIDMRRFDAVTAQDGSFTFDDIGPGAYLLEAEVKPDKEAGEGERMVTTYFPSAIDAAQANPVQVQITDVSGVVLQMRTAAVRKIRGVILDIDGGPSPNTTVGLLRPGSEGKPADELEDVLTDEAGKFEFAPVREGEYLVQAINSLDYDDDAHRALTRSAVRRVNVSERDMDKPMEPVEIRLAQPFALDISTDWGDDDAAAHRKVSVRVLPMDLQPVYQGMASGDERLEGMFPGRYAFQPLQAGADYYLAAEALNGSDIASREVQLSGPASLKLVYRRGAGTVKGKVEGEGRRGVVLVGPGGRVFWGAPDAEGNFVIPSLPPGEYFAEARSGVNSLTPGANESPELKREVEANGERVNIEAGAVATVVLKNR